MNLETYERCEIPTSVSTEPITWQVPVGNWRLMVFTCKREENYQGIDYLSPQAVDDPKATDEACPELLELRKPCG